VWLSGERRASPAKGADFDRSLDGDRAGAFGRCMPMFGGGHFFLGSSAGLT
jgi:hypothetical protein